MNMKLRHFAPVLALLLAVTALPAAAFTDLAEGHWAYKDITELTGQGIVNGYPDGSFVPDAPISTGEFHKLMCMAIDPAYVAQGEERPYAEAASLPDAHWAYEYALRLARLCGAAQVPTAGFAGGATMNRTMARIDMAQLAAVVHRARVGGGAFVADAAVLSRFSDVGGLTEAQRAALSYCVGQGLISGFEDGTFRPAEGLTRAQAAKMTVSVAGGFSAVDTGATGQAVRALRALLPAAVENGGLDAEAYRFALSTLTEYLGWFPQPIADGLAASGCRVRFTSAEGHSFDPDAGVLTLAFDPALLGSDSGRRQAAEAIRAGFNYAAGNLTTARLAQQRGIRLSRATPFDKLAEVAELSLLAWDVSGNPVAAAQVAAAREQGDSGQELLLDMEAAYLLLCEVYGLTAEDRAKINVFGIGHTFTVTVRRG